MQTVLHWIKDGNDNDSRIDLVNKPTPGYIKWVDAHKNGDFRSMPMKEAQAYLNGIFKEVEGWCTPHLWQVIQPLHEAMVAEGVTEPVAEIGIYHGKFFIGLLKTMNAQQHNYAIDVFDLQRFNPDGAGKGNLETFKANLARAGVDESSVEIIRTDSMSIGDIAIRHIQESVGGFSFFSIDGGHLAEHTINDIEIAMKLTVPAGIIFIDDYYNANWPGVQEGVSRLYLNAMPRFVPLAYTCNKLILCNISYHKAYLLSVSTFMRQKFPNTRLKQVKRFGYDSLTLIPNHNVPDYISV